MSTIAIDLGTTNIKVGFYDANLSLLNMESHPVNYVRDGKMVEFDVEEYFDTILTMIHTGKNKGLDQLGKKSIQIVLTGQAESLVTLDVNDKPVMNGISWLDMRSEAECEELTQAFDESTCYRISGQPKIIPTWPITKILWLKNHQEQTFRRIAKFLLLKDYIIFMLTGSLVGEHSIYPFSCYFNIHTKEYWNDILEYCGVSSASLPKLVEPCSIAGTLRATIAERLELPSVTTVNVGTLDHFASMIGTGNVGGNIVNESAGTVASLATYVYTIQDNGANIPLHCGPFKNSYIYLPVLESGGASLEWFKALFHGDLSYDELNRQCSERTLNGSLFFLPYLTGVNPPEFDEHATGVFHGLTTGVDAFDMALSVMAGVACVVRKNIEFFTANGVRIESVISTGGGAKSAVWTQLKSDITNLPFVVPNDEESSCLGAAIIGTVSQGSMASYDATIERVVTISTQYTPSGDRPFFDRYYQKFCAIYDSLFPIAR